MIPFQSVAATHSTTYPSMVIAVAAISSPLWTPYDQTSPTVALSMNRRLLTR